MRNLLKKARRVVVKIGSHVLTQKGGRVQWGVLKSLCAEMGGLHAHGKDVVVVTSGAIRCGSERLRLGDFKTIPEKQAAASIGQGILMEAYIQAFARKRILAGQILLTRDDVADRRRYLNAKHTFLSLFQHKAVPVVNENDTVAVEEIKEMQFGENDTLAALVANIVEADALVLLSDVEGFYTEDPRANKNAQFIETVDSLDATLEQYAKGSSTSFGGMKAKFRAARIAARSGIPMVIAHGHRRNVLRDIFDGREVGTFFQPRKETLSARKCWIAFCAQRKGAMIVNEGAKKAMAQGGKSLLPSGILTVEGHFQRGDTVSVRGEDKKTFAAGISTYTTDEVKKIKGENSSNIAKILGYHVADEVIHRDNLALLI